MSKRRGMTMRPKLIPLLLASLLFAGVCRKSPETVYTVSPVLSSARLYRDDSPAFPDSIRMVVRDVTVWRDVWGQATEGQPTPPPRPDVDFSRNMVLVVSAGRMQPGDWITVDSAGIKDNVFWVFVRTVRECQEFRADAYPFEIVRVTRETLPVEWDDKLEEADNCR